MALKFLKELAASDIFILIYMIYTLTQLYNFYFYMSVDWKM